MGARPNFVKLAALDGAFARAGHERVTVHTGQHYDFAMAGQFFQDLHLPNPDHYLGVGSGSPAEQVGRTMLALEPVLASSGADWVVCVGDVNATVATAFVAKRLGMRVAHVEAGLRSFDWSMPEEINRVVTDRLADLLLASEPSGVTNLAHEGVETARVRLVGNVMIDTLRASLPQAARREILSKLGLEPQKYGVVTLHRPSNTDDPVRLSRWMDEIVQVSHDLPLVFPVHPRTAKALESLGRTSSIEGVRIVPPLGYLDMLALLSGARLVLTDSGGIQEETTALGVPCLTLRDSTERPATVDEGTNEVVGGDPTALADAVSRALRRDVRRRGPVTWDGKAADRVATALVECKSMPLRMR